jgi:Tol biopolymer transport system component
MTAAGGTIAFQANRGDPDGQLDSYIATVSPDGSAVELLGPGLDPAISPNGKLIAFAKAVGSGGPGSPIELFTMSAQGGGTRQLTNDGAADRQPAISPDGRQLAFAGLRPGKIPFTQIFIANGDGSGERALTNGYSADTAPSFAPGGHRIVFARGPGDSKLVSMKADGADGGGPKQLTDLDPREGSNAHPSWGG